MACYKLVNDNISDQYHLLSKHKQRSPDNKEQSFDIWPCSFTFKSNYSCLFSRYLQISCCYTAPNLLSEATVEETRILDDSCRLDTCFGDYLSSNARVVSVIYVLEGLRLQVNYKPNKTNLLLYEYHGLQMLTNESISSTHTSYYDL